jgi:2-dehydropantoate 2-reductase
MRFLIAGAGAVGGYIGAMIARAGGDVTLFARGSHLAAMREREIRVLSPEGDFEAHPRAIERLEDAGAVDVIVLGVKAHGLTQLAPRIKPLVRKSTTVVSTQNGLPWWYFQTGAEEFADIRLERVDPGGIIAAAIDSSQVVGSLVYFATEIAEPGVIRHIEGNRISLGEPNGAKSERVRAIAEVFIKAGLRAPVTTRIRDEIWVKMLGNAAFNPISALTQATLGEIVREPDTAMLTREIMAEIEAVAARLGIGMPVSIEQRIAGAAKVGEHRTSMLQDLEAGRPLEIEAIIGAVVELGERLRIPTPRTRAVYACARLLATCADAARASASGALPIGVRA